MQCVISGESVIGDAKAHALLERGYKVTMIEPR